MGPPVVDPHSRPMHTQAMAARITVAPAALLERLDFLSLLGAEQRDALLAGCVRVDLAAAKVLYEPGQGARVFLVDHGLVRAFFTDADGRQATVEFLHRNEIAGLPTVMGYAPELTLQTVTDTTAFRIDPARVWRWEDTDRVLAIALARYLTLRLMRAFHLVTVRTLGTMRQRLAYDLLERCCQAQLRTGHLGVAVSHAELAASVGASREAVSRTMASLRADRLVDTGRAWVSIEDPVGLASIPSGLAV